MKSLNHYIHTALQKKSRELKLHTRELYKILPANLTGLCSISNIDDSKISILTESPILANKLRYYQNDIKNHFSQYLNRPIVQISLKVSPKQLATNEGTMHTTNSISNSSAKLLGSLSETIEDESLKNSLKKLAKRQDTL